MKGVPKSQHFAIDQFDQIGVIVDEERSESNASTILPNTRSSRKTTYEDNPRPIAIKDDEFKNRPEQSKFPVAITWTPLPLLTQLFPLIGHTGIGDSQGAIHDFAGSYYVSYDQFAFGETHKYVKLDGLEGVSVQEFD